MEGPPDAAPQNCIFCQIATGKIAAQRVYEDNDFMGILDINPANPGHVLLMTKHHYQVMPQIPDEVAGRMFAVVQRLSHAALRGIKAQGSTVFVANGAVAGQRAPHFMLHVIPRVEGDGITLDVPSREYSLQELSSARTKLRARVAEVFGAQPVIAAEPPREPPEEPHTIVHQIQPAPAPPAEQPPRARFLWQRGEPRIRGLARFDSASVTAFFHKHPELVTVTNSLLEGPKNLIELQRVIDFKSNHLLVLEYLGYIRPLSDDEQKAIPIERRRNHPGKRFFAITLIGKRFLDDPLRPLVLSDAVKEKMILEDLGDATALPPKDFDLDRLTELLGGR